MKSTYRRESQRVNLDTESGDVLLFEFSSKMALDKGGLYSFALMLVNIASRGKVDC